MNGIVRIKHIQDYKKVCYYSVCIDNEEEDVNDIYSLFDIFIKNHEKKNKKKLNHILAWLKEIGNKYGALPDLFRPEQKYGEAVGLPPNQTYKSPVYTEDGKKSPNNLRLYCHRLNNYVVFLFCGDLKTADTPQNCPNVKNHFELANKLTQVIDKAFKEREIIWINEDTDIDFTDDLIIYL